MKWNKKEWQALFEMMREHDIAEISRKRWLSTITVRRGVTHGALWSVTHDRLTQETSSHAIQQAGEPAPETLPAVVVPDAPPTVEQQFHEIRAPLVGTFYRAPAPDADPFTDIGRKVKRGETLCIVEAMKNMNELQSDVTGVVREIIPSNGELVEFDRVLFRIEELSE